MAVPPVGTYSAPSAPAHFRAAFFFSLFSFGKFYGRVRKLKTLSHLNYYIMDITGRLTGDAVVRCLQGDRKVVSFSVAVSDSYKSKNGERVTQTEFFDCAYWIATGIAQYLTKGTVVELSGRVSARAWVNSQGEAKAGLNFHTSKITLHGGSRPVEKQAAGIEVTPTKVNADGQEDDLPF